MKKCQKCFYDNDDLMVFCMECGTPLSAATLNTVNFSDIPTQSFSDSPPTFGSNQETETVVNKRVGFTTTFQPPPPQKSKKGMFLVVGGFLGLLFLGLLTVAGIVIYNLIPSPNTIVTLKPTPSNQTPTPTATPQVSFTPPIVPTQKGTFTVYANQGWQISDIYTVASQEFSTTVQGKIDLSGIKTGVSASGVNDAKTKSRRIYQQFPTGALLMRTRYANGNYSNITSLTTNGSNGNWRNYPDERGKLEFCINDNAPENNNGQFTVNVTLTRVPTTKK